MCNKIEGQKRNCHLQNLPKFFRYSKANLVLSPYGKCLVDLLRKTLLTVYKDFAVVCKRKSLFLQQGYPQLTSPCICTCPVKNKKEFIPCRSSPRICLLVLAEVFLRNYLPEITLVGSLKFYEIVGFMGANDMCLHST